MCTHFIAYINIQCTFWGDTISKNWYFREYFTLETFTLFYKFSTQILRGKYWYFWQSWIELKYKVLFEGQKLVLLGVFNFGTFSVFDKFSIQIAHRLIQIDQKLVLFLLFYFCLAITINKSQGQTLKVCLFIY